MRRLLIQCGFFLSVTGITQYSKDIQSLSFPRQQYPSWELQEDKSMETTALTDNKLVMYTSDQVQQMLDMVVRSLSRQGLNNAPVNLDNVINQVTPSDAKITLTVTEAAEMLGISLPKMYEIVRMGRIPSIRVGKKIVISRQAVLDWLKEGD